MIFSLNNFILSYFVDTDSDAVDGSIRLMAAGGNGFKVMVKPPVFKGVYR